MMDNTDAFAFPCEQGTDPNGGWNQTFEPGMTKREYIAALALQGVLARMTEDTYHPITAARNAVEAADELLKRLEQTNG